MNMHIYEYMYTLIYIFTIIIYIAFKRIKDNFCCFVHDSDIILKGRTSTYEKVNVR